MMDWTPGELRAQASREILLLSTESKIDGFAELLSPLTGRPEVETRDAIQESYNKARAKREIEEQARSAYKAEQERLTREDTYQKHLGQWMQEQTVGSDAQLIGTETTNGYVEVPGYAQAEGDQEAGRVQLAPVDVRSWADAQPPVLPVARSSRGDGPMKTLRNLLSTIRSKFRTKRIERKTRPERAYIKPPKGEVPPHCPACKEGVAYEGAECAACGPVDPRFVDDVTGKPLPVGAGFSTPTWETPGTRSHAVATGQADQSTIDAGLDLFFEESR